MNQIRKNRKSNRARKAVVNTASKKVYKQSEKEVKNSHGFFAKIMITLLLMIVAVVFVFVSGAFNIIEIMVEGNQTISKEQIISFSEIKKGTNLFAISKRGVTNRLKEHAYIDGVKIKRVLPNKIKLLVKERKLEYALPLANSYVYIDRQGFVLEISNTKPDVPLLLGISTDLSNIKPNDRLRTRRFKENEYGN